jgi:glycosyltransferase involved in cell wall biosynthesis
MLAAAERLRGDARFIFLFVGGGKNMDRLRRCVEKRGLGHSFRFVAYQPRELLGRSLGVADVHWLSLKPELEGLIVPSKFYGIAAAGRPLIAVGARDGEIARLVRRHDCGVVIEPGDVDTLVATLVGLATDEDKRLAMGARARSMLDAHFARRHAFARWDRVLEALQGVR